MMGLYEIKKLDDSKIEIINTSNISISINISVDGVSFNLSEILPKCRLISPMGQVLGAKPQSSRSSISQTNHIQIAISGSSGIDPEAIAREINNKISRRLESPLFDYDWGYV